MVSQTRGELGEGLYINNVHYLNYSDRTACRMTGMTRFATFRVENGKITAPVNVMRFDETIYRILGEHLVAVPYDKVKFVNEPLANSGTASAPTTTRPSVPLTSSRCVSG